MAKIDVIKEEVAYRKLWLGIAVITDISLVSWFVTRGVGAGTVLVIAGLTAIAITTGVIVYLHSRIASGIKDLENL